MIWFLWRRWVQAKMTRWWATKKLFPARSWTLQQSINQSELRWTQVGCPARSADLNPVSLTGWRPSSCFSCKWLAQPSPLLIPPSHEVGSRSTLGHISAEISDRSVTQRDLTVFGPIDDKNMPRGLRVGIMKDVVVPMIGRGEILMRCVHGCRLWCDYWPRNAVADWSLGSMYRHLIASEPRSEITSDFGIASEVIKLQYNAGCAVQVLYPQCFEATRWSASQGRR